MQTNVSEKKFLLKKITFKCEQKRILDKFKIPAKFYRQGRIQDTCQHL